jgi:hypothetical protein
MQIICKSDNSVLWKITKNDPITRACERSERPTPRKENDAMSPLPTTCPECQASDITYSTGVIHNTTPVKVIEYPVLMCGRCDCKFFALPPDNTWQRCYTSSLIAFTKNPQEIDVNNKLVFRVRDIGIAGWYLVSPGSQG